MPGDSPGPLVGNPRDLVVQFPHFVPADTLELVSLSICPKLPTVATFCHVFCVGTGFALKSRGVEASVKRFQTMGRKINTGLIESFRQSCLETRAIIIEPLIP